MQQPHFIVNLAAVSLSEASARVRIPLVQLGRWVKGAVTFSITREDLRRLVENFRKCKTGEVVIDYEHASESPERGKGEPIPAAGWLKAVEEEPDPKGILWGLAEFTARARRMIADREYKYLSPAIDWSSRDKVSGEQQGATLTSVALVNRPFLEALPAVQLSEAGWSQKEGGGKDMAGNLFDDLGKLDEYIGKRVHEEQASRGIPYKQALLDFAAQNPAMIKLREALYMQRQRGNHSAKVYEWADGRLREIEQDLKGLIEKAQREHPEFSHGQAFKLVASERPDLFREREWLRDL